MRAVYRQTPQVLAEMMPSWRQQYDVTSQFGVDFKGGALNVSGPLVNTSIRIFGTKQVMALLYHCVGESVPAAGAVPIKWFTNWDKVNDKIPDSLF